MKEYNIPFLKYHTHVYQYGELKNNSEVIILLHGGPGGNTILVKPLVDLSKYGYTIITYDQLGSLKSSSIKRKTKLFKVSTFVDELDNLIRYLKIKKFHLLGHSWGGMLALEYILRKKPKGLNKLVLFSSLSSSYIWSESNFNRCNEILKDKPLIQKKFLKAYQNNNGQMLNDIYKKYLRPYYRISTNTSPYKRKKTRLGRSEEIYEYMWGKVDLFANGTLKKWDITEKLNKINHQTLLLYGKYDQSTKEVNMAMKKKLKHSQLVYLSKSGHTGYYNEYNKSINSIVNFLK